MTRKTALILIAALLWQESPGVAVAAGQYAEIKPALVSRADLYIRDPFILPNPATKTYYLYKSMSVRFKDGQAPLETLAVQKAIADAEVQLSGNGRLLIRKSGTEPLIRVMAESEDAALMEEVVAAMVAAVEAAA